MNIDIRDSRPLTLTNSSLSVAPTFFLGQWLPHGVGEFPMCSPQNRNQRIEKTIIISICFLGIWRFDGGGNCETGDEGWRWWRWRMMKDQSENWWLRSSQPSFSPSAPRPAPRGPPRSPGGDYQFAMENGPCSLMIYADYIYYFDGAFE